MITNANRSGSVRGEPKERIIPNDERRSGSVSERETKDESRRFGREQRQRIVEVDGKLILVDAR